MRKCLLLACLLAGVSGLGCMPLRVADEQPKVPQTQMAEKPRVMPEDVNERNGPEMAKRLAEEMRDEK